MIFVVALVARISWVLTLKNELYWSDEHAFWEIAQRLARGEGYVSPSYRANPGLPAFLGLVFRLFGENLLIARLGQCLLGAVTCVLIYGIGTHVFNRTAGILAGAVLAVYPLHIYLAGVFYAEGLLIFWGATGLYLAVRALQPDAGRPRVFAAGVALGLAVLTRSTLLVWIPCVAVVGFWQLRTRWTWCATFLAGSAMVILPWTVRNYFAFHAFVPVSSGSGSVMWLANNPCSTGRDHSDWDLYPNAQLWKKRVLELPASERDAVAAQYVEATKQIEELTQTLGDHVLATDRVLGPLATRYILAHPGETLVRCGRRFRMLFSAFSPTVSNNEHTAGRYKFIAALAFYPLLGLAVVGMVVGLARFRQVAILYLVLGATVGATVLMLATQTRYRLPLDPYLIVFAAGAVARFVDFARTRL